MKQGVRNRTTRSAVGWVSWVFLAGLGVLGSGCGGAFISESTRDGEPGAPLVEERSPQKPLPQEGPDPQGTLENFVTEPEPLVSPSPLGVSGPLAEPARLIDAGFVLGEVDDPTRAAARGEGGWVLADGRPLVSVREGRTIQFEAPVVLTAEMLVPPEKWLERNGTGRPVFFVLGAKVGEANIVNVFHSFEIFDHEDFALERGERRLAERDEARAQWSIPVVHWLGARPGRLTPAMTVRASLELVLESGRSVPVSVVFRVRTPLPKVSWKPVAAPSPVTGTVRLEGSWRGGIENRGDRPVAVWYRTRAEGLRSWLVGRHASPRLKAPDRGELVVKKTAFRQLRNWSLDRDREWQRLLLAPGEKAQLEWKPRVSRAIPETCVLPRQAARTFRWQRQELEVVDRVVCRGASGGQLDCKDSPRIHYRWVSGTVKGEESWGLEKQGWIGDFKVEFRVSEPELDPLAAMTEDEEERRSLEASGRLQRWESRGTPGKGGELAPPPGFERLADWNC